MEAKQNLNNLIDHTNLKNTAVSKDIDKLISEAVEYGFHSVCINPCWVSYARRAIDKLGANVKVLAVIGFSLGQGKTETKVFEAKQAMQDGADELDFLINLSFIKERRLDELNNELKLIREATIGKEIKLIIENGLLDDEEKILITNLILKHNFDFVKTATGFTQGVPGATVEDVTLLKSIVKNKAKVKASGGIKTYDQALSMVKAGADRIGTSNGIAIALGSSGTNDY